MFQEFNCDANQEEGFFASYGEGFIHLGRSFTKILLVIILKKRLKWPVQLGKAKWHSTLLNAFVRDVNT